MQPTIHARSTALIVLALTMMASSASAHLDAGFDRTAGPYVFDVGWTPDSPTAGESTLLAINVLDAATKQPANLSSVWVRLDLKDQVSFAGTLALQKGSASLTYVFQEAGVWTITVQADNHKASGELWVPGQVQTFESWGWIAAAILAIASAILGYTLWNSRRP